jgi:hypothetical protein
MSRLALLTSLLCVTLAACSGSSGAGIEALQRAPDEPTSYVTPAPEEDSGTVKVAPTVEPDSGSTQDAGLEASVEQDSGAPDSGLTDSGTLDSGSADSGSVTPRFGLAFNDVAGERVAADLPAAYIAGGQTQATWEGWFKHDGFPANTQDLNGRLFAHGGENVSCQVVTPAPDASEAGKVECGLVQEKSIRSTIKVSGFGWFHLALTYDSGTFRLFINGSPQGSAVTSKVTLPAETTSPYDTNPYGKVFFGATSIDKYSTTVTVDEFRLTPIALYGGASFPPPKHLSPNGADLLLLLDDGAGTLADGNRARIYSASWVSVSR